MEKNETMKIEEKIKQYIFSFILLNKAIQEAYNPLRPGVLLSADLWDITQNRLLTSTDS